MGYFVLIVLILAIAMCVIVADLAQMKVYNKKCDLKIKQIELEIEQLKNKQ